MCDQWKSLHWLCGLLLLLAGCRSEPQLRPNPEPEAFNVPPPTDRRYSDPITYPRDVMEGGKPKRSLDLQNTVPPRMNLGRGGI
jgi:hypothetical protein